MAQYRKVDSRIWNDGKFSSLSDKGKLAFFFLLTHPHMTSLGAMRASLPGLASELGWTEKDFREAFGEALSKAMVKHDEKACFVWLPNFLKYNRPESPNVVKAWVSSWDLIPECDQKTELLQSLKAFVEGLTEGFAKAFREAMPKDYAYTGAVAVTEVNTLSGLPDPAKPKVSQGIKLQAEEVLSFLNEKASRAYRPTDANLELIAARLKEGATVDDLKGVVENRVAAWSSDDKMREFLRPATLFNRTKFSQYSGELGSTRNEDIL